MGLVALSDAASLLALKAAKLSTGDEVPAVAAAMRVDLADAEAEPEAPAVLPLPYTLLGETPADGRVGRTGCAVGWRAEVVPFERVGLLAVREEGGDAPDIEDTSLRLADVETAGVSCSVFASLSAGAAAAPAARASAVVRRVRLRRGLLRRAGEAAAAGGELAPSAAVPLDDTGAPVAALVWRRALADALRLAGSTMVTQHVLC